MINYYHVLGLAENATPEQIKAAFKKLAVMYHPDKHPGREDMEERFKEINQAHQILSDPYEKARFDLKLKYQRFSGNEYERGRPTPPYSRPKYRSAPYYQGRIDKRQNAIATAYAFGITFLIAILVMGGVWIKSSYDDKQYEKVLSQRRATFEQAKENFDTGNYLDAFEIMTQFKYFEREENDIKKFKRTMIDQIIKKGDTQLKMKKYDAAISLYTFIFDLRPDQPFFGVKKKLAQAYKHVGEVDKSIDILEDFLVNEYDIIESLVELAEIHRDYLNDDEKSMENFQLAHRLAIKRYRRFYGEAYPILIKQEYVPESHYRLYTGLAAMYLQVGDPTMAIKAADWNKYVWPDSIPSYTTSAEAYLAVNNRTRACEEYQMAAEKGWIGDPRINCN